MTNEEARQWFLKVYSEIKGKGYADENEEAYELAIKALEQEPIDKSNLEKICEELAAENDDLRDQLAMRDRFKQEPNIIILTQKEYSDLCIQLKGLGWKFVQEQEPKDDKCHYCEHNFTPYQGNTGEFTEQEPTSVKQYTVPVKLRINKVYKHISNIDLDELKQEQNLERLKDKLHDKIEIYVCEVEENTLIAQGMLKALGMMDEVLENAEKGGK